MPSAAGTTERFGNKGQVFTALDGGPHFKFNEAVSRGALSAPRS